MLRRRASGIGLKRCKGQEKRRTNVAPQRVVDGIQILFVPICCTGLEDAVKNLSFRNAPGRPIPGWRYNGSAPGLPGPAGWRRTRTGQRCKRWGSSLFGLFFKRGPVSDPAKQESHGQSNDGCAYANRGQGDKRHPEKENHRPQELVMDHKQFQPGVHTISKPRNTLYKCRHICLLLMATGYRTETKTGEKIAHME